MNNELCKEPDAGKLHVRFCRGAYPVKGKSTRPRIRKYAVRETAIEEAVDRAVSECMEEGILADFLRSQRAEVIAMSIFEYNEEEEMRKLREGEREIWEK